MTLSVLEPATEQVLAEIPRAGIEETDAAVARAKAAGPAWRALAPADRARLLYRLADALDAAREELAQLEARNAGKPIGDARGEMGMVADTFRYYAGAPERVLGDTIPVAGGVAMTFREPLGVVALITPWNFPLTIAAWKLAPALAGGNTVVLKPAELTPLTALRFEQLALEAGVPEGVVNVVVGPGRTCGTRLVEHPDVAKIAFTGSTEVGASIAAGAAQTIKRVTLELGGKSPNLVFADADLEAAAAAAPWAVFGNAGQDCCARSRILVESAALDRFMDALEEVVEGIRAISIRPGEKEGTVDVREDKDFVSAVAEALGVPKLTVVATGGDAYQQQREQWDDGNNVVALEPGVVVAYERNTFTISKMREAGVEVIEIAGFELGKGRGGGEGPPAGHALGVPRAHLRRRALERLQPAAESGALRSLPAGVRPDGRTSQPLDATDDGRRLRVQSHPQAPRGIPRRPDGGDQRRSAAARHTLGQLRHVAHGQRAETHRSRGLLRRHFH